MVASSVASVVVVGGGIAGVSTVTELRKNGYAGELTLVSADAVPYDRPPLSKDYLAGGRDLDSIALQALEWYAEQRIDLVGGAVVVAVRPEAGEVELDDGRVLRSDRLVLATGGRAVRPSFGELRRDVPAVIPAGKGQERPVVSRVGAQATVTLTSMLPRVALE